MNSYGGSSKFESYSTKGYENMLASDNDNNNNTSENNADGLDHNNPMLKPLLKMK